MRDRVFIAAAAIAWALPAAAAEPAKQYQFDIPASGLSVALRQVALEAGFDLIAPSRLVDGRRSPAIRGTFTREAAVAALLEGSGLSFTRSGNAVVIVGPDPANGKSAASEPPQDIV